MYDLLSGDYSNASMKDYLCSNPEKAENVRKRANLDKINYILFNEDIDGKMFNLLVASLTLGDELQIPIGKKMADVLFFALCNNAKPNKPLQIRNVNQANVLFNLYENDYDKIELEANKQTVRFTELVGKHPIFVPGYTVIWKLPISFFKANGKSNITLSGLTYCILNLNGEDYKIPREIYIKFLKSSMQKGRLIADSTDEIKDKFDLDNMDALSDVFQYLGFSLKRGLGMSEIPIPNGHMYVDEYKVHCVCHDNSLNNENNFWLEIRNNEYVLLPRVNYIPLKHNGSLECIDLLI